MFKNTILVLLMLVGSNSAISAETDHKLSYDLNMPLVVKSDATITTNKTTSIFSNGSITKQPLVTGKWHIDANQSRGLYNSIYQFSFSF